MALSVGLVGCGHWGRHILRDLKLLECTVHVVARSDASVERARAGDADTIVTTSAELPDVAGIVVAVPTNLHADIIDQVLPRGVPVFVEKPLTDDPDAARRLGACPGLFVMDKWRYHPGVEALRDLARSGDLGAPTLLTTVRHSRFNPHSDVDAVWILAPHDLAIILEVLGSLPAARTAVGESRGLDASLVAVLGDDPPCVVHISSRTAEHRREIRVHFREAVAMLLGGYEDAVQVRHDVPGAEPRIERIPISTELPLLRELRAFVGHLDGGPPPLSSAADGAAVVERIAELRALAGI
jgi:predicted dehydrogenase